MYLLLCLYIAATVYFDKSALISTETEVPTTEEHMSISQTESSDQGTEATATTISSQEETASSQDDMTPTDETVSSSESFVLAENDPSYFDNALFIGDSRTVGLKKYGNIDNATFFAHIGLTLFDLDDCVIPVTDKQKLSFQEVLSYKKYDKIYLMLGINELGDSFDSIEKKYRETVTLLEESQKEATIYLCANMHITKEHSQQDDIFNNENVNRLNDMISGLADNETTFYLDVNELFDDEEGNLSEEYASDSFHVLGIYYQDWVNWIVNKDKTIS